MGLPGTHEISGFTQLPVLGFFRISQDFLGYPEKQDIFRTAFCRDFTLSEVAISRSLPQSRDTLTKHKGKGQSSSKDEVVPDGQAQRTLTSESLSPVSDNATPDILNDAVVPTTELSVPSKETEDCTYPNNYLLPVHLEKSQARSYVEDTEQPVTDNPIEEKQPEIKAANEPLPVLSKGSDKEISIPRGKRIVSSLPVLSKTTPECHLETETKSPETTSTTEVVRNPGIIGKLKKLFGVQRDVDEIKVVMTKERFWDETVKAGKKKLHHRKIAPVIIWDFGGQDVFYSTHQTFLTYRAIYLLVLDGSRNLDDPCVFEQYLPGKSGPKTARVTDNEFLKQTPTDIHLRRLSMEYSIHETKELSIYLGMKYNIWESLYEALGEEAERLNFEILHRCIDSSSITFDDIRKAAAIGNIQNPHTLCKEPEIWDYEPSEEHFDRLAPFVGNNSLPFLIELGMEFKTWEQIRFRQKERDLVKLNRDIMQEWKSTFCNVHAIRPSLRHIGQAFNNIGKNIKIIENVLADFS
ncbi:inlA [Mytilus edulis]|uniref:InlA n=1 Tax=Mytilus edulis TaxID=6550 RepID=A0A8S3PZ89_MYTED|nr:inlA [Mytilus edulis]